MNNEKSDTPTADTKKSSLPMTPLEEAFNLETSILRILLKRHRAQHHRAHYFRHLTMTLHFIDRHHISSLSEVTRSTHMMQEERILEFERSMAHKRRNRRQVSSKKKEEEDQWELNDSSNVLKSWTGQYAPPPPTSFLLTQHKASPTNTPLKSKNKMEIKKNLEHSIAQHIQWLHCMLTRFLPCLLNRIQRTFQILLQEVAKGYFLPFSSIAIGTLARIRVIAMRWGREGVAEHMNVVSTLAQNSSLCVSHSFKKTIMLHCFIDSSIWMKTFMEIDPSWNPTQSNNRSSCIHGNKKHDQDARHDAERQSDHAKKEKILKDTERSMTEYNQTSKDNNDSKISPILPVTTNDDNEDMGESVDINNFKHNPKSIKVITSPSPSPTEECLQSRIKEECKTVNYNVTDKDEEDRLAIVDSEKELKSNVKRKKNKSSKRKRPFSSETMVNNDSELKMKKTLGNNDENENIIEQSKSRKKKKKSDTAKKKRKKSKATTKDIFDEIFDGI